MRIDISFKKVIVPKYCIAKMSLKIIIEQNVSVQKFLLVLKWPCVQKSRRAKTSPRAKVSLMQKFPIVQKWPCVQKSRRAKVSTRAKLKLTLVQKSCRAKVYLRAKVSSCKSVARAKVTRSHCNTQVLVSIYLFYNWVSYLS